MKKLSIFKHFLARDSAEASAEASVDLAEASVSAETNFSRFGRSLLFMKVFEQFHVEDISTSANNIFQSNHYLRPI